MKELFRNAGRKLVLQGMGQVFTVTLEIEYSLVSSKGSRDHG
jgi:hypothetical protein